MSIEDIILCKLFVYFFHSKLDTPIALLWHVEIINPEESLKYMDFMNNVTKSLEHKKFGKIWLICSITYL